MAIVYSLSASAPPGLEIDPNTGVVTNSGDIAEGSYIVEVYTTDTDTGESKLCQTLQVTCSEGDVSCVECIEDHLSSTDHLTKEDVEQCVATALVDWIPPEPQKDFCDKNVLRINYCGKVFDFLDWDGDGITDINLSPKFHSYVGGDPDPAEAVTDPVLNSVLQTEPDLPLFKAAGPPGPNGGLSKITHFSNGKVWVPLCCAVEEEEADTKCLLVADGDYSYPFNFVASTSYWPVGGVNIALASCGVDEATFCSVSTSHVAEIVFAGDPYTTGANKPDLGVYAENGFLTVSPSEMSGCDGVLSLTGDNGPAQGEIFTLNTYTWLGNQGSLQPSDVSLMKFCFDVAGTNVDLGVGVFDVFGVAGVADQPSHTWQPVIGLTGPSAVNNGDYVQITGPGSYEVGFTVDPAALAVGSNTLRPVVFGLTGNEQVSNMRFKVVSAESEPCGQINSADDFAEALQEADPDSNDWYVDTAGNICANLTEGDCLKYSAPVISVGDGVEFCQVENETFPLYYDPFNDSWVVDNQRIYFGGSGVFQTAQEMSDWMTLNDPRGNLWTVKDNGDGTFSICALLAPGEESSYQAISQQQGTIFQCIVENETFPITYDPFEGFWLLSVNNIQWPFPVDQDSFETADDLAAWLTDVYGGQFQWVAYLEDEDSQTYSICAVIPAELHDFFGELVYNESDKEYCCQSNNLRFPLDYTVGEDGWYVGNEFIPFDGDGTFDTADELTDLMTLKDPLGNTWNADPGVADSFNICALVPNGQCSKYEKLTFSGGKSCVCPIRDIEFPYEYTPGVDGWQVGDQVIPFDGDGTFDDPAQFAQWLTDNDPNGYAWRFEYGRISDTFTFCADIPTEAATSYNVGLTETEHRCNFLPKSFPYDFGGQNDYWLINGDQYPFEDDSGDGPTEFGTPTQFAQWLTDTDPNGYAWFYQGPVGTGHRFCAVMPSTEGGQYQGFY